MCNPEINYHKIKNQKYDMQHLICDTCSRRKNFGKNFGTLKLVGQIGH